AIATSATAPDPVFSCAAAASIVGHVQRVRCNGRRGLPLVFATMSGTQAGEDQ
ncbi:unnamed protein product, partial [Ectocarpus sp. 13 AM-2016]